MLKVVDSVLEELGLVRAHAPLRYYINISTGYAISISAYLDAHTFFQVKASEFVDLSSEFGTLTLGWDRYPKYVPQPLGYRERDGWSITVARGVRHVPFRLDAALRGHRDSQEALENLHQYFHISGQQVPAGKEFESHGAFLTGFQRHFLNSPYAGLIEKWTRIARSMGIESLPLNDQHGDLTENNLARSGKQLIIFDWEDYGACLLPGLDLTALIFSVYPNIAPIQDLIASDGKSMRPVDVFVRRACDACGFDIRFYQKLMPFYLLTLLYSKRNYGRVLQDRIGDTLKHLDC